MESLTMITFYKSWSLKKDNQFKTKTKILFFIQKFEAIINFDKNNKLCDFWMEIYNGNRGYKIFVKEIAQTQK